VRHRLTPLPPPSPRLPLTHTHNCTGRHPTHVHTEMPACLYACPSVCLSVCLPACLPACLSVCLSVCLPASLIRLVWCWQQFAGDKQGCGTSAQLLRGRRGGDRTESKLGVGRGQRGRRRGGRGRKGGGVLEVDYWPCACFASAAGTVRLQPSPLPPHPRHSSPCPLTHSSLRLPFSAFPSPLLPPPLPPPSSSPTHSTCLRLLLLRLF